MHIIYINILQAQNSLQLAGYSRFYFMFYLHRFSATNTIEEPLFMTPTCFHGYEIRVCWFEHGQFFHGVSALGDLFKLCMHHIPNLMRYSTKAYLFNREMHMANPSGDTSFCTSVPGLLILQVSDPW